MNIIQLFEAEYRNGTMKKPDTKALKEIMQQEDITTGELSLRTGLNSSELDKLLEGKREFRASEIYKIADALELDPEQKSEIFFGPEK